MTTTGGVSAPQRAAPCMRCQTRRLWRTSRPPLWWFAAAPPPSRAASLQHLLSLYLFIFLVPCLTKMYFFWPFLADRRRPARLGDFCAGPRLVLDHKNRLPLLVGLCDFVLAGSAWAWGSRSRPSAASTLCVIMQYIYHHTVNVYHTLLTVHQTYNAYIYTCNNFVYTWPRARSARYIIM